MYISSNLTLCILKHMLIFNRRKIKKKESCIIQLFGQKLLKSLNNFVLK